MLHRPASSRGNDPAIVLLTHSYAHSYTRVLYSEHQVIIYELLAVYCKMILVCESGRMDQSWDQPLYTRDSCDDLFDT